MNLSIAYEDGFKAPAQQLVLALDLAIDNCATDQLRITAQGLQLCFGAFKPLKLDFTQAYWQKRRDAGKTQGLIKACKPKPGMKIIDVTAGWGRDAAILASFGANVLMLEQHPVVAALLKDALQTQNSKLLPLSFEHRNAQEFLTQLTDTTLFPEVIYIDPMHPQRQKQALVKKELQILQAWVKPDAIQTHDLIVQACTKVTQRVVVKWPQKQAPLLPPDLSFPGKTVRFDVYYRPGACT